MSGDFSSLMHQPVWDRLQGARRVLVAGCGGGYDFVSGLPLYLSLRRAGVSVFLANLTFTSFESDAVRRAHCEALTPDCLAVTHGSASDETAEQCDYWPELLVAKWLHRERSVDDACVYMLRLSGVQQIAASYAAIVKRHSVDAVLLADGGTDSLMRGDEASLATPVEDLTSIAAVHQLEEPRVKLLFCTALGVDSFHGVNHFAFLENVAALDRAGHFLGCFSLQRAMPEARDLIEAVAACKPENSIVCSQLRDAVEGHFGNYHSNRRTRGSTLFISPLMSLYWAFDLDGVAKACLYLGRILHTTSPGQTQAAIYSFHEAAKKRQPRPVPI